MPTVVVLAATGFESVEMVTPIDLLRRAGADLKIASVGVDGLVVKSSQDISVVCDVTLESIADQEFDLVFAPGGMPGTQNLAKSPLAVSFVQRHFQMGKYIAAICAAPGFFLAEACGIMKGLKGCGYPGCEKQITENGGIVVPEKVVVDHNVITSKGVGTAPYFALKLVQILFGDQKATDLGRGTLIQ